MKPICSEWEERLSLYVDGLLNPFDENAVAAHLSRCEACREAVALWRAIGQSVRRLPRELPPAELRARIFACTTRKQGIRQRLRLSWWQLAPACAAGLLLAWWTLPRFIPATPNTASQLELPRTIRACRTCPTLSDLPTPQSEALRSPQPAAEAAPSRFRDAHHYRGAASSRTPRWQQACHLDGWRACAHPARRKPARLSASELRVRLRLLTKSH
jgi:anti-sigma factor RsiW